MPWDTIDDVDRDPMVRLGMELLGASIRRRRQHLGWSQRELARRSFVEQSTISRLENGRRVGLRVSRLARIIAALDGLDATAAPAAPPAPAPARSIRSMYRQIAALHEAILQARIDADLDAIEVAEREDA